MIPSPILKLVIDNAGGNGSKVIVPDRVRRFEIQSNFTTIIPVFVVGHVALCPISGCAPGSTWFCHTHAIHFQDRRWFADGRRSHRLPPGQVVSHAQLVHAVLHQRLSCPGQASRIGRMNHGRNGNNGHGEECEKESDGSWWRA